MELFWVEARALAGEGYEKAGVVYSAISSAPEKSRPARKHVPSLPSPWPIYFLSLSLFLLSCAGKQKGGQQQQQSTIRTHCAIFSAAVMVGYWIRSSSMLGSATAPFVVVIGFSHQKRGGGEGDEAKVVVFCHRSSAARLSSCAVAGLLHRGRRRVCCVSVRSIEGSSSSSTHTRNRRTQWV
jgi:hypothetical protein